MNAIAWIAVFAAAWTTPQQPPDGIVTIKNKSSTWSFKVVPEGRQKLIIDEQEVETDVPQRVFVVWAVDEHYRPLPGNGAAFTLDANSDDKTVHFFREGKTYAEFKDTPAALQSLTREELAGLQKSMVEEFYQVDLDFPGGTWEDLAKVLRDRLSAAYEQQFPEILKPFLPAKVELEISTKAAHHARYPAIQAKGVTLALLRAFGPAPVVEGKTESIPRVEEQPDKSIRLVVDVHRSPSRLVLSDANAVSSLGDLEVAFFHLGSKPTLPAADHVVALFELAWKARGGPLYAKVKYHPETKTLMVQGREDEIQAADKVFATLTGRPAPVAPSANPFDNITQTLEKIADLIEKQTGEKDKDK